MTFSLSLHYLDLNDPISFKDTNDTNITKRKLKDGIFTEGEVSIMKQYMREYKNLSLFDLGKKIYYKLIQAQIFHSLLLSISKIYLRRMVLMCRQWKNQ